MNKKLTIILPLYNRKEFSYRFLDYLNLRNSNYSIVLADAKDDGFSSHLIDCYKNLDLKKITFKQSKKFIDYYRMILLALKSADTEYVMLADNDDFLIDSSITELINFLDNNDEFCSAGAKILQFQIDNYMNNTYGKSIYFSERYAYSRSVEPSLDINKDLENIFMHFQPNFYNIFRSEILTKIWTEICDLNFTDLTITEFYIMLRTLTIGKQKTFLNMSHYIRQAGTGESEKYDFFDSLLIHNLPSDIRKLAHRISYYLERDIENIIFEFYKAHLKNFLWPRIKSEKARSLNYLHKTIQILPPFLHLKFIIKEYLLFRSFKSSSNQLEPASIREIKSIRYFLKK